MTKAPERGLSISSRWYHARHMEHKDAYGVEVMGMYGFPSYKASNSSVSKEDDYTATEGKINRMKEAGMKASTPRKNGPPKSVVVC